MRKTILFVTVFVVSACVWAQEPKADGLPSWMPQPGPRVRVLVDNDLCGDGDGLFHLAHQLLCTSAEVCGVVGAHLGAQDSWQSKEGEQTVSKADISVARAREVAELCGKSDITIRPGAVGPMNDTQTPVVSEGARLIIEQAHRATVDKPLYLLFGGPLTDIASAWLMDPTISKNVILLWIGGQEYSFGHPFPADQLSGNEVEYNLRLDVNAARVVFNQSDLTLWQIPRDVYRQALYGIPELEDKIAPLGKLGEYLMARLGIFAKLSDTYVLGDSPLCLISTLTTTFEPGAGSCFYEVTKAPHITPEGRYDFSQPARDIIVYRAIDTRLMFGDMESRFRLLNK